MINRKQTPHREIITAQVWPMIAEERKAKQEATQFKPGNNASPDGRRGKETVALKPYPPIPRDSKQKNEQSTVGQIAKRAKVSHHKAAQVVAVARAVEAGVHNDLLHEAVMMQAE